MRRSAHPQRCGVQPRLRHGSADRECSSIDWAGSGFRRLVVGDPAGLVPQSRALQQTALKSCRSRGDFASVVPYGDGPLVGGAGLQVGAQVLGEDALLRLHSAGVSGRPVRGFHGGLPGGLHHILPVTLQLPAEAWLHFVQSYGIVPVFYGQVLEFQHSIRSFLLILQGNVSFALFYNFIIAKTQRRNISNF